MKNNVFKYDKIHGKVVTEDCGTHSTYQDALDFGRNYELLKAMCNKNISSTYWKQFKPQLVELFRKHPALRIDFGGLLK